MNILNHTTFDKIKNCGIILWSPQSGYLQNSVSLDYRARARIKREQKAGGLER